MLALSLKQCMTAAYIVWCTRSELCLSLCAQHSAVTAVSQFAQMYHGNISFSICANGVLCVQRMQYAEGSLLQDGVNADSDCLSNLLRCSC
jgi:hypothetical protein